MICPLAGCNKEIPKAQLEDHMSRHYKIVSAFVKAVSNEHYSNI